MMKIEQLILKFIDENNLIGQNEKILVALSGGPDSVFLLHFLVKYKNRFKIDIGAVHINHKLRKKTADEDEEFCRQLCRKLNIPLYSASKNVKQYSIKNKLSIEEAARIVRYSVFKTVAEKYLYNKIATAHNLSDNTETVFLNLIKGTGLKGVAGIPVMRQNIIRPILPAAKNEIEKYLAEYGIDFRIDESNKEDIFERNFLRNNILPLIKGKINPSVETNIFRASDVFRKTLDAFNFEVSKYSDTAVKYKNKTLELDISAVENPFIVNNVINESLKKYFNYSGSYEDIKKITGLSTKKNGKLIELKDDFTAYKENGLILIKKREKNVNFEEKSISVGEKIRVNDKEDMYISLINKNAVSYSNNKKEEFVSGDKLTGKFIVRKWKAGDKFSPLGLNGVKKVSDFLNEAKLPREKRENQLLLLNNNKIVWVIGLQIDDRYKITENTKKALAICLKRII